MSEVRHDPLSGQAVIIAPGRSGRPHSNGPRDPSCPFCPGQEHETPPAVLELPPDTSASGWFVRVFANLYPIVSRPDGGEVSPGALPAAGVHEVIVETPRHDQEMAQRSPGELRLTLVAYRERLNALLATPGVRYVSLFRNKGATAGSSLAHPHSQAIALSYVPAGVTSTVRRWRRHHARTTRCLLCDELSREREAGTRIVVEQDGFVLYTPFGSPASGEMILAPLQHTTGYGATDDMALACLSDVLLSAAKRLHTALEDPAFNLLLQTWPKGRTQDEALHWFLRIVPRRASLGGFELTTGDFVSTLSPETAAALYRNAV